MSRSTKRLEMSRSTARRFKLEMSRATKKARRLEMSRATKRARLPEQRSPTRLAHRDPGLRAAAAKIGTHADADSDDEQLEEQLPATSPEIDALIAIASDMSSPLRRARFGVPCHLEYPGDQDYQLQHAIQNSMGFESQKGESEYVMDSEEEGDEDYHFQLAIQQSLGFESQNAEDGGNGVYDEPGFGAQTDEPFVDDEIR
jgi:hypothetical protein